MKPLKALLTRYC